MTSVTDFKIASMAAGFTLGFGFLTTWNAIEQTRTIRSPLQSKYILMVWGEIIANLSLLIVAYLFIAGTLPPTVPVLFVTLSLWVFQLHFLMQIIINRIAVVIENRRIIPRLRWGTFCVVALINISVFCIWIPAHLSPPPFPILVKVNKYWDRIEKVLIFSIDGALNYYFLIIVNKRLVKYHGLSKYKPLVSFNAKLMVVSIAMDVLLICLMELRNGEVYVQFHPLVYTVKLNIELSMASLIRNLARGTTAEFKDNTPSIEQTASAPRRPTLRSGLKSCVQNSVVGGHGDNDIQLRENFKGIMATRETNVQVDYVGEDGRKSRSSVTIGTHFDDRKRTSMSGSSDEQPLATSVPPGTQHDW